MSRPTAGQGGHIMVDLETMGSRPGSVIASIGACVFDPVGGSIGATFYRTVSLASASKAGLKFDGDTVGWWLKQGGAARAALFVESATLAAVLNDFHAWWRAQGGEFFWSHGANFDDPILAEAFRAIGGSPPWDYWNSRCTRTVFDLAGVRPDRAEGVHHTARDDAKAQAAAAILAYRKLGLDHGAGAGSRAGVVDIARERQRQVETEGWSAGHDDDHGKGELALAAAAYAAAAAYGAIPDGRGMATIIAKLARVLWPWDFQWWKPRDARRNLVRAGALCAAEIDRLDRQAASGLDAVAGRLA